MLAETVVLESATKLGQARGVFQPAFNLRPRSRAQDMLALRDWSDPAKPKRFEFGFKASPSIMATRTLV